MDKHLDILIQLLTYQYPFDKNTILIPWSIADEPLRQHRIGWKIYDYLKNE